ncbi:MAG: hypothetical protein WKF77_06835 [Planctomycetaceae bacterium]
MFGTQGAPLHGDPGLCYVTPLGFLKQGFAILIVHEAKKTLGKILHGVAQRDTDMSAWGTAPGINLSVYVNPVVQCIQRKNI